MNQKYKFNLLTSATICCKLMNKSNNKRFIDKKKA